MTRSAISRRTLVQGAGAALGAAMVPIGLAAPAAAEVPPLTEAVPAVFDPAAYVADLRAIGCQLHIWHPVRAGGMAGRWCYGIRSPGGRGFGDDFRLTMARWSAAIMACPEHGERVAAYLAGVDGEAA